MKVAGSQPREENFLFPVSNGILTPKHRMQIGSANWLFLWFIDHTTIEKAGVGLVHGGTPIKLELPAKALGLSTKSILRHLRRLERKRYTGVEEAAEGYVVTVLNSKKWLWRRDRNVPDRDRSVPDADKSVPPRDKTVPKIGATTTSSTGSEGDIHRTVHKDIHKDSPPAKKRQADQRFSKIVEHYFLRTKQNTEANAQWDGPDGDALNRILKNQPDTPAETINRWLDNAFDSTDPYAPLKRGFRFTEFGKQYLKYTKGPLRKGEVASRNQKPLDQQYSELEHRRAGQGVN